MDEYLSYLESHAILTVIVFAVGRAVRRGIGAESAARRVHGRHVFWWAVGAFAIGRPVGPSLVAADLPNGAAGFAMLCLLGGWLVGTLHGAVVLAACPTRSPVAGSPDSEPLSGPPDPKENTPPDGSLGNV